MRYCTLADLKKKIALRTLIELSNDEPNAGDVDLANIETAINDAEELVDGHLRGRHDLPLNPVPPLICNLVIAIARHELYSRRPDGDDLPPTVTSSYKESVRILEAIRDGKMTLGAQSGGPAAPEPGEMKVKHKKQLFIGELLEKY